MSETLTLREKLQALEQIDALAREAHVLGSVDSDSLRYDTERSFEDARSQGVGIFPVGKTPGEQVVVQFVSPCLELREGLTRRQARELLKLNEETSFARYGLWEGEETDVIVASCDVLLDSLEPTGFEEILNYLCTAADDYEKCHGVDVF